MRLTAKAPDPSPSESGTPEVPLSEVISKLSSSKLILVNKYYNLNFIKEIYVLNYTMTVFSWHLLKFNTIVEVGLECVK